jgi:thiamine thiazole synthase
MLDEIEISKGILDDYFKRLNSSLRLDVAIVGSGPAGLVAGYYLAKNGIKTAIFERKLSIGGGMWGGGIMFNTIVVQEQGKEILDEFGVNVKKYKENYYTAKSVETVCAIGQNAIKSGVEIFNLISVEDVMFNGKIINGIVINWSSVEMAGLHIDPICISAKFVVDATGHPAEIVNRFLKKNQVKLNTPTGKFEGEKSMFADRAETDTMKNTGEVFPGLCVCGMAANATFGSFRMGPIFGGMLLSGQQIAQYIIKRLATK